MILVEVAASYFIFLDDSWKDAIPSDTTGDFNMIYHFLRENWRILKWVAIGVLNLEALALQVAVLLRGLNLIEEYGSEDEYIKPRFGVREPLMNKQAVTMSGVPALEHRPSRNDTWSLWMREKSVLDTSELSLKASDPSRSHQAATLTPADDRARCVTL